MNNKLPVMFQNLDPNLIKESEEDIPSSIIPMQRPIETPEVVPAKKVPSPEDYIYDGGRSATANQFLMEASRLADLPDQESKSDPELIAKQQEILNKYNTLSPDNKEVQRMSQFDSASRLLGSLGDSANQYLQAELNKYSNTPREYTSAGLENKAVSMAQAPLLQKQQEDESKKLLELYKTLVAKEKAAGGGTSNIERARIKAGIGQALSVDSRFTKGQTTLNDKTASAIENIDRAIGELDYIKNSKVDFDTGPIAERVDKFKKLFGGNDAKRAAFRSDTKAALSDYVRQISGTAASDNERRFIQEEIIPGMEENDEVFLEKLKAFKGRLSRARGVLLDTFEKKGKNVEAYREEAGPQASASPKEVERKTKDGKTAIFDAETKQFIRYK
jgi:hypothetical protein